MNDKQNNNPSDWMRNDPKYAGQENQWQGEAPERFWHICENCGKTELLSPQEAYEAGWDYPPMMGLFGILSQRNCPNCLMKDSLWWRVVVDKTADLAHLNAHDMEVLRRILGEPESLRPRPEDN